MRTSSYLQCVPPLKESQLSGVLSHVHPVQKCLQGSWKDIAQGLERPCFGIVFEESVQKQSLTKYGQVDLERLAFHIQV